MKPLFKIFFLFSLCTFQALAQKRVVLVSWDGLRPAFLTDPSFSVPHLKKLMHEGSYSLKLSPIDPTLTYPNHTAMVTGRSSGPSEVLSNTVFDEVKGPQDFWNWESSQIKVPTLWSLATNVGKSVALIRWPVTKGASVRWNIPEVFQVPGIKEGNRALIMQAATPGVLKEIETAIGLTLLEKDEFIPLDQWIIKASLYLEKTYHPDLQLIHLSTVDHIQHETGIGSKETKEAVSQMDAMIGELSTTTADKDLCLIVLGDHGHGDYKHIFRINSLLHQKGYIQLDQDKKVVSWTAIAHPGGSQAAIYLKHPQDKNKIITLIKQTTKKYVRILDRKALDRLKIYPTASFAVVANINSSVGGGFGEKIFEEVSTPKSTHGYLASDKEMKSALIMSGCGMSAKNLGNVSMLQIAPTVASLLDLPMKNIEARPLVLKSFKQKH